MTVRELIERLERQDHDAEVYLSIRTNPDEDAEEFASGRLIENQQYGIDGEFGQNVAPNKVWLCTKNGA